MNEKYTKTEWNTIIETKKTVSLDPIFKGEFDIDNDDDVIKGLYLHINKYYMSTQKQEIAHEIFRKNGLWIDGKTTLEDRDKQLLNEKVNASIAFREAVTRKKTRLREFKKMIDEKIQTIESKPIDVVNVMDNKRDEIQDQARQKLNNIAKEQINELSKIVKGSIDKYRYKASLVVKDLKNQLDVLKQTERSRLDAVLKEYDELISMQREYAQLLNFHDIEIKQAEKKIDIIDEDLFEMTVRELKKVASEKGLSIPARILKKELIELIQGV